MPRPDGNGELLIFVLISWLYTTYTYRKRKKHALLDKSRQLELSQPRPTTRHEVPWAEVLFPRIAI